MTEETNEYGDAVKRPAEKDNKCVGCAYYRAYKEMRICFYALSVGDILHGESVSDYTVNGFGCDSRENASDFTPKGNEAAQQFFNGFAEALGEPFHE